MAAAGAARILGRVAPGRGGGQLKQKETDIWRRAVGRHQRFWLPQPLAGGVARVTAGRSDNVEDTRGGRGGMGGDHCDPPLDTQSQAPIRESTRVMHQPSHLARAA